MTNTEIKMTNSKALEYVLTNAELPEDVREKITNIKASIDKKNSADRKPTKTQIENVTLKEQIVECLANAGKAMTVSEIIKADERFADLSSSKVTSMLTQLKAENKVVNTKDGKRSLYSIA